MHQEPTLLLRSHLTVVDYLHSPPPLWEEASPSNHQSTPRWDPPAEENESNVSQTGPKATEKPETQGLKVTPRFRTGVGLVANADTGDPGAATDSNESPVPRTA